jgi:Flp pilus assembly pilin Flp
MKKVLIFVLGAVAGIALYTHPKVKEGVMKGWTKLTSYINKQ